MFCKPFFWPTMEYILINISAEFGKNVIIVRIRTYYIYIYQKDRCYTKRTLKQLLNIRGTAEVV